MDQFNEILGKILGIIWGPWMPVVLIGTGIYLTIGTRFIQIRKFGYIMKQTFGSIFKKPEEGAEGTIKPFQAATSALSATVGVGNIVGVATAIVFGGPGAVFWMWVTALVGMCTKYAEIVLAVEHREKNENGDYVGGPQFYMKNGLKMPALGWIFALLGFISCFGSGMVQANAVAGTAKELFNIPPAVTGILLIVLVGVVSIGGVKRLGKVTEKLVPFMVICYLMGGLVVILANAAAIPAAFAMIFQGAFTPYSVGGGVAGYAIAQAIRFGVARGLYSNEAGMGSAPMVHATAITDHPSRQGMWGAFEVFVDTIIVCTFTALTILTSGVFSPDADPAVLTISAFGSVIPYAEYVVGISLILFAYTTLIGVSYYGTVHAYYLGKGTLAKIFTYAYLPFCLLGSIGGLATIWGVFDVMLGIIIIPNLFALLVLSPTVFKRTKEFFDSGEYHKIDQ